MFLLSEWVKVGQSVWLFATSWTVQSLEFSRPEYWSVGSLSLLQGMFPTQGWNPGLPHCGLILYQLSYKGSPRILGSLSLLQRIFPTQESNWGLLHCRQIYQGSPNRTQWLKQKKQIKHGVRFLLLCYFACPLLHCMSLLLHCMSYMMHKPSWDIQSV